MPEKGMEYDLILFDAVLPQQTEERCTLLRLHAQSDAVLLRTSKGTLLLGDVQHIAPDVHVALFPEEVSILQPEEGDPLSFFCRMAIPYHAPKDAAFDLNNLLVTAFRSGRALFIKREGLPLVPLLKKK